MTARSGGRHASNEIDPARGGAGRGGARRLCRSSVSTKPSAGCHRRPDRPDLADFQSNGALAAAKAARRNPREIATAVVEALAGHPAIALAENAGPGFVNLKVSEAAMSARARGRLPADRRAGVPYVVDAPGA